MITATFRPIFTVLTTVMVLACADVEPVAVVDPAERRAQLEVDLRARLGDAYDQPPPGLSGADPERGASVYHKSCGPCHGSTGRGDGPRASSMSPRPTALAGPGASALPDAAQLEVIRSGSPGTGMPGWGRSLPDERLIDVYAYVLTLR